MKWKKESKLLSASQLSAGRRRKTGRMKLAGGRGDAKGEACGERRAAKSSGEGSAGRGAWGPGLPERDRRGPALSWTPPPAERSLGAGAVLPGPSRHPSAASMPAQPPRPEQAPA